MSKIFANFKILFFAVLLLGLCNPASASNSLWNSWRLKVGFSSTNLLSDYIPLDSFVSLEKGFTKNNIYIGVGMLPIVIGGGYLMYSIVEYRELPNSLEFLYASTLLSMSIGVGYVVSENIVVQLMPGFLLLSEQFGFPISLSWAYNEKISFDIAAIIVPEEPSFYCSFCYHL